MSADIRSLLLELPVEVWDRILFWMSLSPLDVANFAKASRHCHFLAFGPVNDRNEYNVLQHGALLGPLISDFHLEGNDSYFTYLEEGGEVDRILLAVLRMADQGEAAAHFELMMCGLADVNPVTFSGETLFSVIEDDPLEARTRKLLRQVAEEFEPADFQEEGKHTIHEFGALSGIVYGDGPQPKERKTRAAKYAAIGGQCELLKRLLEDGATFHSNMIYQVVRRDHFDCFEMLIDHVTSGDTNHIHTTCIFEQVHFGYYKGFEDEMGPAHPYHLRVFQEVAKGSLPLHPSGSRLVMNGGIIRKIILKDEHPEVLLRICIDSGPLTRLLASVYSFDSDASSRETLTIVEMLMGIRTARVNFSFLSKAIDAAAKAGRVKLMVDLILKTGWVDPNLSKIYKSHYPKWYANRILLPLCVWRDWDALRREVGDFAEEANGQSLAQCFRSLTDSTNNLAAVVSDDRGLTAVRQVVAAFTPWLFGGE
jgi:hypothetical protein